MKKMQNLSEPLGLCWTWSLAMNHYSSNESLLMTRSNKVQEAHHDFN